MPAASLPPTHSESRASGVSENARRRQGPTAGELRNALALDEALAGVLEAGGGRGGDDDAAAVGGEAERRRRVGSGIRSRLPSCRSRSCSRQLTLRADSRVM